MGKTDLEKVFAVHPRLREALTAATPAAIYQLLPTTPYPRVLFPKPGSEGDTEANTPVYPMWPDIETEIKAESKLVEGFEGLVLLMGFALGYQLDAATRRPSPFRQIVVWEPNISSLKWVVEQIDCTDVLTRKNVAIVLGPPDALDYAISVMFQQRFPEVMYFTDKEWGVLHPKMAEEFETSVKNSVVKYKGNASTVLAFGELLTTNVIKNLPKLAESPHGRCLQNATQGFPAIIIGSGPSIKEDFHTLRWIKGLNQAVLICADSALRPLLNADVIPDFVVSVDPQAKTGEKLDDLDIPTSITLVHYPGVAPEVLEAWPGPRVHVGSSICSYALFKDILGSEAMTSYPVQCQGHLAADVARVMGCSPILMTGFDLAYTDDSYYLDNGEFFPEGFMEQTLKEALTVTDKHGKPTKTSHTFLGYGRLFEDRHKGGFTLINCTAWGLKLGDIPGSHLGHESRKFSKGKQIYVHQVVAEILTPEYPTHPSCNRASLLPLLDEILKEMRYYEAALPYLLTKLAHYNTHRRQVNKQTLRVYRRFMKDSRLLEFFSLVGVYGELTPVVVKTQRGPYLGDQQASKREWVGAVCYYTWLRDRLKQYRPMMEKTYDEIRHHQCMPKVRRFAGFEG